MWNWLRKIPTPGYGKCGGANRDCSITKPRDWMDLAFEKHDNDLHKARTQVGRDKADQALGKALRKGDPKKLSLYGRIYRWGAMFVFKPKK